MRFLFAARIHLNRRPSFPCDLCPQVLTTMPGLKNHKISTHKLGERIFSCDICQRAFRLEYQLKAHQDNLHGEIHECNICWKLFKGRATLRGHVARAHSAKTAKCHICHKVFRTHDLRQHLKKIHVKTALQQTQKDQIELDDSASAISGRDQNISRMIKQCQRKAIVLVERLSNYESF